MATDILVARELKSLQDELASAKRDRIDMKSIMPVSWMGPDAFT
ncbi:MULTISPECIES: hypothetical protein [Bradyrhizobium]|nr:MULTISPECIES: hypothetical protein [Bradyrhizobium]